MTTRSSISDKGKTLNMIPLISTVGIDMAYGIELNDGFPREIHPLHTTYTISTSRILGGWVTGRLDGWINWE